MSDKSFTVEPLEGGYLFTWKDNSLVEHVKNYMYPERKDTPKTFGKEIFTDKKKLLKRIETFLK